MPYSLCSLLAVGVLLPTIAAADDAQDEAIRKERQRIQGTWRITELVVNGNKSKPEDVRKLTVVNDDQGGWKLYSAKQQITGGTSTFDPTQQPRRIDFTPTEGDTKGQRFLGIYELEQTTRKLCFATAGRPRPLKFSSTPEDQQILVRFARVKPE